MISDRPTRPAPEDRRSDAELRPYRLGQLKRHEKEAARLRELLFPESDEVHPDWTRDDTINTEKGA